MSRTKPRRRWVGKLLAALVLLAVGAGSAWALMTVMRPADVSLDALTHTYVSVQQGEVGESLRLNAVAQWTPVPVGVNRAAGVLTEVKLEAGAKVVPGDVLYTVDLRPVMIAQGEIPAFRDIGKDASGKDVEQVQQLLKGLKFFTGDVTGKVGPSTTVAIKRWQKSLGLEETGEVLAGDIVFVPTLPAHMALDTTIHPGDVLAGGENVVLVLPQTPQFQIPVTDIQAGNIPAGIRVELTSPEGQTWQGFAGEQTVDQDTGAVAIALAGESEAPVCGDDCSQIPITGQTSLAVQLIMAETVGGLVVPSAALISQADGSTAVIDQTGTRIPVEIKASANGMSIVDGVQDGLKVQVPAKAAEPK